MQRQITIEYANNNDDVILITLYYICSQIIYGTIARAVRHVGTYELATLRTHFSFSCLNEHENE